MAAAFQPHPIPWTEFPTECIYYLYFMTVVHLVAFGVGSAILAVLPSKQPGTKLRRICRFGLYNGLLLLVGSIFNGLWSCLIWDRLYDSTDYVLDFIPFLPIGHWALDRPWGDARGRLLGLSLFQLQLVWPLFAAGNWGATTVLYRLMRRCRRLTSAVEATAGCRFRSMPHAPGPPRLTTSVMRHEALTTMERSAWPGSGLDFRFIAHGSRVHVDFFCHSLSLVVAGRSEAASRRRGHDFTRGVPVRQLRGY